MESSSNLPKPPDHDPRVRAGLAVSQEGRHWLSSLGMVSAPQFLAFLVIALLAAGALTVGFIAWQTTNMMKYRVEQNERQLAEDRENVRREIEGCQSRHNRRDEEDAKEHQRQWEREQLAAKERDQTVRDREGLASLIREVKGELVGVRAALNAFTKKFTEPKDLNPDGSR